MKTTRDNVFVLGAYLLLCTAAIASEQAEQEEMPSIEFLEFLGSWKTNEGAWVDPLQFIEEDQTSSPASDMENGKDDHAS